MVQQSLRSFPTASGLPANISGGTLTGVTISGSTIVTSSLAATTITTTGNIDASGNIAINKTATNATLTLNADAARRRNLASQTAGVDRCTLALADSTAESGANAGSNLTLFMYDDSGVFLSSPLQIIRATGAVSLGGTSGAESLRITPTASQNRYLIGTGANNGNPSLDVSGGAFRLAATNTIIGADIATPGAIAGTTGRVQVQGTNVAGASAQIYHWGATTNSGILGFAKSRSGVVGTQTVVQSGDVLGHFLASGSDGTAFIAAAQMTVRVDGTPGTNDMPGRFEFSTTPDGASSPVLAMSILQDQTVRLESASFAANGSVATVLGSVGPTGANTTVQEWVKFRNSAGVVRYIPAF